MRGCASLLVVTSLLTACATTGSDGTLMTDSEMRGCTVVAAPTAPEACEVVQGSGSGKILIGTVLTEFGAYENSSVLIGADGRIVDVACDVSMHEAAAAATTINCAGAVISPGLINPHDHLYYNHRPPSKPTGERYDHRHHWRLGLEGHKQPDYERATSDEQLAWSELRHALSGTTAISGLGGVSGLVRNLENEELKGDLQGAAAFATVFPLGDAEGLMLEDSCGYPQLVSAPEYADASAFQAHVAEGVDRAARNEIACLTGQRDDGINVTNKPAAFVHFVAANADDAIFMRENDVSVIWSPRSNIALYGHTANVTLLDRLGVNIALSTDWVPSGSMNMLREFKCAADYSSNYLDGYFSAFDFWKMATLNAAKSFAMDNEIGSLKKGLIADITVYRGIANQDPYETLIQSEASDVMLVLRSGKPLLGRSALLDEFSLEGARCESISEQLVCGETIKVCFDAEEPRSMQTILAANPDSYELMSCQATPRDEPTCLPSWSGAFDGELRAGIDDDGDGIENSNDNCPTIFNPTRPLDGSVQSDWDGDAIGDACDKNPLE